MAKHWDPGKVKTRLGVTIGMEKAARLHRLFVTHLTRYLYASSRQESTSNLTIHRTLVVSPPESQSRFRQCTPAGWKIEPQVAGDLGVRMQHWFTARLSADYDNANHDNADHSEQDPGQNQSAILIGADCPTIADNTVGDAARLLKTSDLVLGPAVDGGYYLVGLRAPWRSNYQMLFADIPWSTGDVFDITCQRANAAGISIAMLPEREDVDTIVELEQLRSELKSTRTSNIRHNDLAEAIDSILSDTNLGQTES